MRNSPRQWNLSFNLSIIIAFVRPIGKSKTINYWLKMYWTRRERYFRFNYEARWLIDRRYHKLASPPVAIVLISRWEVIGHPFNVSLQFFFSTPLGELLIWHDKKAKKKTNEERAGHIQSSFVNRNQSFRNWKNARWKRNVQTNRRKRLLFSLWMWHNVAGLLTRENLTSMRERNEKKKKKKKTPVLNNRWDETCN